ncbi:type II CRISPR-associated endonuclease Cas1 [Roseibium sp. CAU 1637]|uniref:CRISPR-associated endonuclease Cas1 n=1 Tax=Roseibium limicola TaxID=2816037 RepID=A0A939ENZ5_9HYPH|nr:type II CRISPR-associated endonuclease Cas1 [Roseibium limicola]MBO0346034.1 type II CRISPR-associated endonuclease Cas1 [Roseibium limicola]
MHNRIVEIVSDGVHISVSRGFLKLSLKSKTVGQIAIDDIAGLVIRGHGASLSANICSRLADANVPVIICNDSQTPAAVIWPVSGHFAQGLRMQAQAVANKPVSKRLWAQLVKTKIMAQAFVLEQAGRNAHDLREMSLRVKSGDSGNLEAQAARRYWPRLMGVDFRRDRTAEGINAALNYGYAILRAAAARSILSAGLHPSLSLNHQSRGDALRLADDLMEPFRPWIDLCIVESINTSNRDSELVLDPDLKADLVNVLSQDLHSNHGASPLQLCMDRLAQSLAGVFLGENKALDLPGIPVFSGSPTMQAAG